jgi:hypothetical protein
MRYQPEENEARREVGCDVLQFSDIRLGESGGGRCRRCHGAGAETIRDTAEVLAAIDRVAREWTGGSGPNLALTGVEPFRHPDLARILSAAVDAGAQRIRLDTDATALGSPNAARLAVEGGARHLEFALLGSEASRHDALIGDVGAFEQTLAGVGGFVSAADDLGVRVHVSARVPVCRHNLQDVLGTVAEAAKAGARSVRLVVEDPLLSPLTAAPWIASACDTGIVHAIWVAVEGFPLCAAAGWELHLASLHGPVAGTKAAACGSCALDDACGGAAPGAAGQVTGLLRPPAGAEHLAGRIRSSFERPAGWRRA